MKKLSKIILASILSLGLVGCSNSGSKDSDINTISVGLSPDYAPYELKLTDGTIEGFDIDMMNLFEGYLEEITGEKYEFEIVEMEFDGIIGQINGGQVDVGISGFSYDEDRVVEWSKPYLGSSQVAVLPKESTITSVEELKGKVVAAQSGSTGETYANEIEGASVSSIAKVTDIFTGLEANQFDVAIVDSAVAKNYVESGGFKMLDDVLVDEKNYVIAKKGNTEVIDLINQCIDKMLASDDYAKLCEKHGVTPYSE